MNLNKTFEGKVDKIFYSRKERNFLNQKYQYFTLYISKDIFITKENNKNNINKSPSIREEKVNENMISNDKIKGIKKKIVIMKKKII